MGFAGGRTRPLHRYGKHHLSDAGASSRRLQPTCLIDESDQVQLLGDPHQRSDITDPLCPYRSSRSQIDHWWRIRRAQHGLPREWSLPNRIPHRLGGDPVPTPSYLALKHIYSFI